MTTFVVIGSGPSLTQDQIDKVFDPDIDVFVIAVNDNYKLAPWADYIFAADQQWWKHHYLQVISETRWWCRFVTLAGNLEVIERYVISVFHNTLDPRFEHVRFHRQPEHAGFGDSIYHGGNSGLMAIDFARTKGADKIVLIGFDGQPTGGKDHWFGNHPQGLVQNNYYERWQDEMRYLNQVYERLGIDLVNCSPQTALTCRRSTLDEELPFSLEGINRL